MADDIKSLAARIQKLENQLKGISPSVSELERKGKYLDGVLDAQNRLIDQVAALEKRVEALKK